MGASRDAQGAAGDPGALVVAADVEVEAGGAEGHRAREVKRPRGEGPRDLTHDRVGLHRVEREARRVVVVEPAEALRVVERDDVLPAAVVEREAEREVAPIEGFERDLHGRRRSPGSHMGPTPRAPQGRKCHALP